MALQPFEQTPDTILQKIDEIMDELRVLRQAVVAMKPKPTESITAQLLGALGEAQPDELDYSDDIYVKMFSE